MFENFDIPKNLMPSDPRFGVGPSIIPVEAVKKLTETGHELLGTSHRKEPIKNLVKEIQTGISEYFKLPKDYQVILGNGGATLFWDMMGFGMVEKSSLHFICGEFSDKWHRSFKQMPWISADEERVDFGQGINPSEKEGYDFLCYTLNETSTGVMVSEILHKKNPEMLVAIDATSGAGQVPIDFNFSDVYYFSPQKVFASDGGLYVAILSPKAVERIKKISQDKSRFIPESLKLTHAVEMGQVHQTYNTPAIATLFFLNEQIKLMNTLGEKEVVRQAKEKADLIYSWAEERSYLEAFVKDPKFRSIANATINVDEKFKIDDLCKMLRAKKVAYDIEGYRKLGLNQLRISLFHNVSHENLTKLLKIIDLAIESEMNRA